VNVAILWLLLWTGLAGAGEVRIAVESTDIFEGRQIEVQIQATDVDLGEAPQLPSGEGLGLEYRGRSGSSQTRGRRQQSEWIYVYNLSGLRPGLWQLGPVSVQSGSGTITAQPVQITVHERPDRDHQFVRLSSELQDPRPFEGEVVVYELEVLNRGGSRNLKLVSMEYGAMIPEPDVDPGESSSQIDLEGMSFQETRVGVPLRAVSIGRQQIPPTQISAMIPVDSSQQGRRGSVEKLIWSTPAIDVEVRPLPEVGRPASFSGLVGQFELDIEIDRDAVELGESVTLHITIQGNGSLDSLSLPQPPAGHGYRVYDEPTESDSSLQFDRFIARAKVERTLVPEATGELTIDPIEIAIFDPTTERYEWLRSEELTLTVLPGRGGGAIQSFSQRSTADSEDTLGEDILPAQFVESLGDHRLSSRLPWLFALPSILLLTLLGAVLQERLMERRSRPHQNRMARLSALPRDPDARLGELSSLLHAHIGEALGLQPGELDAQQARSLSEDAGALYVDLQRARYAGESSVDLDTRVTDFLRGKHS
jgi:hypothetical protein